MTVLATNLKRFRLAGKMTQEQAAEALGVSAQSISRWECDTTMPDVSLLPEIAKLYCVTIDDLFRENSEAYKNYSQRLGSVYEATLEPQDFVRADQEYRKLLRSGEYTEDDLRLYGIMHQHMMYYCIRKAFDLYDRVLARVPETNPEIYWRTKRQKGYLLFEIGRNRENIEEFLPLVEAGSNELQEWICLIQAYEFAGEYDAAWKWLVKAEEKFPESAMLHTYSGNLCRAMKRYGDAFSHWKRARELEPEWLDAAYAMGECYEELEDYQKAYEVWCGIVDSLMSRGFESEVEWPRSLANRCKEKITY